jgi:hypothetical protein
VLLEHEIQLGEMEHHLHALSLLRVNAEMENCVNSPISIKMVTMFDIPT